MGRYRIVYTKQAVKDAKKISNSNLKNKTITLIDIIKNNPFQTPPPFEKLIGDLKETYSRRINIHHRMVYQVYKKENIIKIIRLWTHYE